MYPSHLSTFTEQIYLHILVVSKMLSCMTQSANPKNKKNTGNYIHIIKHKNKFEKLH